MAFLFAGHHNGAAIRRQCTGGRIKNAPPLAAGLVGRFTTKSDER
jgi:hypothetical protein